MMIEKNIPLPSRFPFANMQVGDSFLVPETAKRSTVSVAARRYGEKHGWRFSVRLTEDRKLRCWRVA